MTSSDEIRPRIEGIQTSAELRRWYWTKDELLVECRRKNLKMSGGKFVLLDRIAHFLDTGQRSMPEDKSRKPTSSFDWHSADLSPSTPITDSYKNTQNVRRFFKSQIGESFKFNSPFMAWMRDNSGKTLADAVAEYQRLAARRADPKHQSQIADHNQFNQYTRDFLADNPQMGMKDVRHFWALKRARPSEDGRHRYHRSDLRLGK
ncbi:MAG: DUF6434 domain-containing protein [Pseudomonadota bacterium]